MDLVETNQAEHLFKLGNHQLAAGDLKESAQTLKAAGESFLKEAQYNRYVKVQIRLITIYVEMENFDQIDQVRKSLVDVIWRQKESGVDQVIFHYVLGMCYFKQNQREAAQQHFNQGLAQAIQEQKIAEENNNTVQLLKSKIDMSFISYGFVCLLYSDNYQIPAAVQELTNMGQLLEQCKAMEAELKLKSWETTSSLPTPPLSQTLKTIKADLQKLDIGYQLVKANILGREKKYDSAEKLYWVCYELSQKNIEKKYLSPYLFYSMGINYMEKEDYAQASIFLNLAKKSIHPNVFKKLYRVVNAALEKLKENIVSYDIVVNFDNKLLIEKQKGNVNFKNQFILLDMLRLFVTNPGTVYSKEALVEKVWKQQYDPCTHDNKIYVTVKRLRELVEPDYSHPKYIFRKKEGYYFDKGVKILLK